MGDFMLRPSASRFPLALAVLIVLSGACGGSDDDDAPPLAEYETEPGPNVPQPPSQRDLTADGTITVTPRTGGPVTTSIQTGGETGFSLVMTCGATTADAKVALYVSVEGRVRLIELKSHLWYVDGRVARRVDSPSTADAGAGDAGDAGASTPPPTYQNGVGLPDVDGRRAVFLTLDADGTRYDIDVTIPWLASVAPATCQKAKPGTSQPSSSGGGCGGNSSSSKRSSGGDWD